MRTPLLAHRAVTLVGEGRARTTLTAVVETIAARATITAVTLRLAHGTTFRARRTIVALAAERPLLALAAERSLFAHGPILAGRTVAAFGTRSTFRTIAALLPLGTRATLRTVTAITAFATAL
ncbi:MAG: hypothetical protein JNK15_15790, partial [Planctomycetes bacterium]|nr:hypothetical protein [Planctomycetota bacterium]